MVTLKKHITLLVILTLILAQIFTFPVSAEAFGYSDVWNGTWNVRYYSYQTPEKIPEDDGKTFHIDATNGIMTITYNHSGGDRKAEILSVTPNTLIYRFSDITNAIPEELPVFQLDMQKDCSILSHYGKLPNDDVSEWLEYAYKDDFGYYSVFEIGKPLYTSNTISYPMDAAPYITNSNTFLPVRFVAYSIGLTDKDVIWDQNTKTVTLIKDGVTVNLQIGSNKININGSVSTLDVAPEITSGRTCLPVRAVAEAFGGNVIWDSASRSVTIAMMAGNNSDIAITSLLFSQWGGIEMEVGESQTIYPVIYPASATNKALTWYSSNNSVIAVNNSGMVTAVGTGTAKITVKSANGKIAYLDVNVAGGSSTNTAEITLPGQIVSEASILTASQIYSNCSPSVFYITLYDKQGNPFKSGSGFFISSDGLAVTCAHVMKGASAAQIMRPDGSIYWVDSIIAQDHDKDIAIIKIDGHGFPYLPIGNSNNVGGGEAIYTIGSPLGLSNTISDGIISNPARILDGKTFIQISAPTSSGSSGGALINEYGQVIGITSATFSDGQNLNLAIPINQIYSLQIN